MSKRIDRSWLVFTSIENFDHDRCVDLFSRPDGSFGFEEFRRDPEDRGEWTVYVDSETRAELDRLRNIADATSSLHYNAGVRYAQGAAEIAAAEGDLRLSAPNGRVVLSSGLDVSIEASR